MIKQKPYRPRAPKLAAFKSEKKVAIYLYDQYWFQGRTLRDIAKGLGISNARVKELLVRFHIGRRSPGQRMVKT